MEELGTTLNLEEFLDASYRLYNVRILNDISYLIDIEHSWEEFDTQFQKTEKITAETKGLHKFRMHLLALAQP